MCKQVGFENYTCKYWPQQRFTSEKEVQHYHRLAVQAQRAEREEADEQALREMPLEQLAQANRATDITTAILHNFAERHPEVLETPKNALIFKAELEPYGVPFQGSVQELERLFEEIYQRNKHKMDLRPIHNIESLPTEQLRKKVRGF